MSERLIEPRSKRVRLTPREFKSPSLLHTKEDRMLLLIDIVAMRLRDYKWRPFRGSKKDSIIAIIDENLWVWAEYGEEDGSGDFMICPNEDPIFARIDFVDGAYGLVLTDKSDIRAYMSLEEMPPLLRRGE
jgi:hypothetical protein